MGKKKPGIKTILLTFLTLIYLLLTYSKVSTNNKYFSNNEKKELETFYVDAICTKVIDGDTIEVEILNDKITSLNKKEKIRLIGVNTPELNIHKKEPPEYYAQEAYIFTKSELEGKYIKLQFDNISSIRDKYKRLLCYVWIDDFLFNKILIETGYGKYYPNFKFNKEKMQLFEQAEKYSKINKIGIWQNE